MKLTKTWCNKKRRKSFCFLWWWETELCHFICPQIAQTALYQFPQFYLQKINFFQASWENSFNLLATCWNWLEENLFSPINICSKEDQWDNFFRSSNSEVFSSAHSINLEINSNDVWLYVCCKKTCLSILNETNLFSWFLCFLLATDVQGSRLKWCNFVLQKLYTTVCGKCCC